MQNFNAMKNKLIIRLLPFLIILFISISSCRKDFQDLNTNPYALTKASDGSMFNTIISSLHVDFGEKMYMNNEVLYKQTQLATLSNEAWSNITVATEEVWKNYYQTLALARELQDRWSTMDDKSPAINNMRAMLKIIIAYKTFKVTDLFGDIPYSEAGLGYKDATKLHPKFDSQESIYKSLLNDLKWADEHITIAVNAEPLTSFIRFDKLFTGDMSMWQRFANSLRLRHAMRMCEVDLPSATTIVSDVLSNDRPLLRGLDMGGYPYNDNASLWPIKIGYKSGTAFEAHKYVRMGTNIWHQMSESDSTDGSGIYDPRAYLFFETNGETPQIWRAYPQHPDLNTAPEGGLPYGPQRKSDGGYGIKSPECHFSPVNFFLVTDEDDVPEILMSAAEVHFLKAEIYTRGIGVAVDENKASIEYSNGVIASISFWKDNILLKTKLPQGSGFASHITIPPNINGGTVQDHHDYYKATTTDEKLAVIYGQCWIDLFWQPNEAYALARRTNMTPREGAPINHFSFPAPPSEAEYNAINVISSQGNYTRKVWWNK